MKLTRAQQGKFGKIRRKTQMLRLSPSEFEQFVGWLYQKKRYRVKLMGKSGDQGIDLTLRKWGRKTVVQVKRYSGTVGQPVVRDLYGAMIHSGAREAHLVTTGAFSKQAEAWAAGKPIVLVDGSDMIAWVNRGHRLKTKGTGARRWIISPGRALTYLLIGAALAVGLWFNRGRVTGWLSPENAPAIVQPTNTPPIGVTPLSATPTPILLPAVTPGNNPAPIPPIVATLPATSPDYPAP